MDELGSPTTWLDDAGNMRLQMLLQGDRATNSGGTAKLTSGFSTKYGAGRLKMRHRSDEGMDAPWLARSGYVDISDGEVWSRWVNADALAQPIDADVDFLNVAMWWFEPESTTAASDIVMKLDAYDASTCSTLLFTLGDTSFDNRKRLIADPNGVCWKIRIEGWDVTPTGGVSVRRVYWAYYFEDKDRDDVNGPSLSSPPQADDVELP